MKNNLDLLTPNTNETVDSLKIKSLQLSNFCFFGNDKKHNTFDFNCKNTIIFGENGSGKSSIFKAFEFLAKNSIKPNEFFENKNKFALDENNQELPTSLNFTFSNNETLILDDDHLEISTYQKEFHILKSNLNYKSILKINYRDIDFQKKINIYPILKELLKDYQVEDGNTLSSITNPDSYFEKLEEVINDILLDNIRNFLRKFSEDIELNNFIFTKEFSKNQTGTDFVVNIELDYQNISIEKHHLFFNEARLTSLAISIYFAIIKHFSKVQDENSLKIMILDDLLISLDMSNRMKLLSILKDDFSNFQIIFLTHDRELFEVYKDSFETKYELYLNGEDEFEKPFIKKHLNYFELAEKYFSEFDYSACANYLRKEVERLKKIKKKKEDNKNSDVVLFKKFKKLLKNENLTDSKQHSKIVRELIGFKQGLDNETSSQIEFDLLEIKSITNRILNPYSHDDVSKPLYKSELENAIESIRKIRNTI